MKEFLPKDAKPGGEPRPSLLRRVARLVFVLSFFLLPAFLGFGNKLLEFFAIVADEEGTFAVTPIVNYLLATAGFFFMLCWAAANGMFRDIEKPKETMLANERFLDEEIMIDPLTHRGESV
jgi:hypothetical protein